MMWDDNIKYQHINSYSVYYLPNVMPMMPISTRLWSIMNVIRRTTIGVEVIKTKIINEVRAILDSKAVSQI